MRYKKIKPSDSIKSFVECFYIWESAVAQAMSFESPPPALCSIVYNYKSPYQISNSKYEKVQVPKFFICGQPVRNYTLHINGQIGIIGIVLRPATLYHCLKIPMYGLTDERIFFAQVFPNYYSQLKEQLTHLSSAEAMVDRLERFMMYLLKTYRHGTQGIIDASNEIFDSNGQCNIQDLIKRHYMSRRTFERKFLEEVGVSPKTYAKIRRFGYTCSLMAGNREVDLMDVLHQGGYYDQSHFIKDFKYFSGRTPRKYAQTNEELSNHLDKISIIERKLHSYAD